MYRINLIKRILLYYSIHFWYFDTKYHFPMGKLKELQEILVKQVQPLSIEWSKPAFQCKIINYPSSSNASENVVSFSGQAF